MVMKVCVICGDEFNPRGSQKCCSKVCSKENYIRNYRERNRKWREANPDKNRERKRKWREANRDNKRKSDRKWKFNNPEKVLEEKRKWSAKRSQKTMIKNAIKLMKPENANP